MTQSDQVADLIEQFGHAQPFKKREMRKPPGIMPEGRCGPGKKSGTPWLSWPKMQTAATGRQIQT